MKENYDRRKFLKASILGIGAFFVNISPIKSFANNTSSNTNEIILDADLLYAQAKDFFYKKEYKHAASLYQQLIGNFPDKCIYYDGYARVLGAEQKVLEIAELYREGLLKNPDNPYFMQRLALRMYDLCMGNRRAELEFCLRHGDDILFEASAELLLQAINITPRNKGFYLNLRDVLEAVKKKNLYLEKKKLPLVVFSEQLEEQILTVTSHSEPKWENSRASRKPAIPEDVEAQLEKIKNRRRRHFHDEKEKKEFEKSLYKARKQCKKHGMESGLKLNNINKIERYAMSVLEESLQDTDTIGKLRNYYRKTRNYDKIITLNRYLYDKQQSPAHSLALANSLTRYGKNSKDFDEAKRLLLPLNFYLDSMGPVYTTTYYISNAEAYAKTNNPETAKEFLLQALLHFKHNMGKTYVFLEKYAVIGHTGKKNSMGIDILKTLSNKESLVVDKTKRNEKSDVVWDYVDKYMDTMQKKSISLPEQLKPLNALLKLHNGKNGDYIKIENEIRIIKEQIISSKV